MSGLSSLDLSAALFALMREFANDIAAFDQAKDSLPADMIEESQRRHLAMRARIDRFSIALKASLYDKSSARNAAEAPR